MNTTTRLLLIALLSMPLLAACQKEEAPAEDTAAVKAPLTRPATNDDAEWGAYLSDVVTRNMGDVTRSPYLYYLPGSDSAGFEGARERLTEEVSMAMQRGIVEGNLVAFGSPESAMMADIIVNAFTKVDPGSMKGVVLLFIGDAADNERVKAAVAPAGVEYKFVEAK
ncbi:hypothetical protein [Novilysobacter erysipheiresistens]|uniref:Lipoprotein n=1 Tax=Novilysobacter erysipheiresistens TaxID=1749332 RepID=A0ABU7YTW3_9GAMM